jgi:hypothetical protein
MAKLFDPSESLTKMLVEYHAVKPGRSSNKQTYYSFLNLDKKNRQRGIMQLRKLALKERALIQYAGIYCNISGELIETVISNGRLV